MQKLLGSPIKTFAFNRLWATFFALGTVMFGVVDFMITFHYPEEGDWFYTVFMGALMLVAAFLTVRTISSSVTIHENGLSWRGLRNSGEMTWDEIETFRYSVVKTYHQGIIPTTEYKYILVDAAGQKAQLGNTVQNPRELGDLLWKQLHARLLKKMTERLKAGQTLKLGKVSISAQTMEMPTLFGRATIRLQDIVGVALEKGQFMVTATEDGKKKHYVAMVGEVDNVFPLGAWITETLQARAPLAMAARA
ncbi:MAG TPA: DUF6585 family protein [Terriglobales bacterium]|nr:DUF6585 family protein [Terriglobales bacterium]